MNLKDVPVIDLDLYYRESNQPDYLKTDDANGRYRKYRLAYGGTPMDLTGVTARCYMTKADGKSVYIDAEIEGNVVTVCFTNQALACPGVLKVEIVLYGSDNSEISSFIMEYVVIKSLRNPDTLESTNEFSALVSTINTVNDLQAKEQLIQAREAVRVANEDTRIATEATRESDEVTRKNNEVTRQASETTRVDNENTREGKEFTRQQDETTRKANEVTRQSNETGRVNAESTRVAEFNDIKNQWNSLSPDQASNVEVQQARRDVRGVVHDSLTKRLESDSKMRDTLEETKEDTYLTFDGSVPSPITNVIVNGNTYQNPNNLVEIVSSGIPNGDGTFKMSILSVGENLFNKDTITEGYSINADTGLLSNYSNYGYSDFIRVSEGQSLTLSKDLNSVQYIYFYKNNQLTTQNYLGKAYRVEILSTVKNKTFTVPNGAKYCVISSTNETRNIKLQEGTIATQYTPYQETRCDIKLPCQLEKVWETCDKLYYDFEKSSWCISKIIDTLNPLDYTWYRAEQYVKCSRMAIKDGSQNSIIGAKSGVLGMVSNALTFMSGNQDEPHLRIDGGLPYGNVNVYIEGLNASESDLKAFAKSKNMFIKYIRRDAKIIELPQSEQIKLNSFANKTHIYTISGDVDATVKATVSKSHTSATLCNTDKIIDVENRLQRVIDNKDDVEYTYKSTKGYVVAKDTNRGNISKATINGKSLVNVIDASTWLNAETTITATDSTVGSNPLPLSNQPRMLSPNDEITIIPNLSVDNPSGCYWQINYMPTSGVEKQLVRVMFSENSALINIKLPSDFDRLNSTFVAVVAGGGSRKVKNNGYMVIKGTIDYIPQYINGIGSVYNPNGLELKTIDKSLDYVTELVTAQKRKNFRLKEPIQPNSVLTNVSNNLIIALLYDVASPDTWTQDITIAPGASYTIPTNRIAKIITIYPHNGWIIENEVYLEELVDIDGYPRRDNNKIFYKDTDGEYQVLTELQEFDTLDLTNCKYIHGTGEVVSTDIKDVYVVDTKTDNFVIGFDLVNKADGTNLGNVISDKYAFMGDDEHVQIRLGNGGNSIFISDKKTKFTSLDKNGAIAYIKANPFTAIYPLSDYATYETNSLSLDVFDGDTLVTTNATNIKPEFDVTITSSINSLIGNIDDTLDNAVDDIQELKHDVAKLTSSKEYEFSGDGYKVMNETEQGTLSDLTIYGKSLVNIADFSKVVVQGGATKGVNGKINFPVNGASFYYEGDMFGKLCTAIFIPENNEKYTIHTIGKDAVNRDAWFNQVGIQVKVLNNSEIYKVRCYSNSTIANSIQCYIVRGDVSQNPPSYFEGIASVGNGNEIEVLSLNPTIDYKDKYDSNVDGSYYFYKDGTKYDVSNMSSYNFKNNNYGVIKIVGKYTSHITFFNGNSFISGKLLESPLFDAIIKVPSNCTEIRVGCRNDLVVPNIYLKQDKKTILFKDTDNTWKPILNLRGIDENNCDIVDSEKGKLVKKYNQMNINKNLNIILNDATKTNTIAFAVIVNDAKPGSFSISNKKCICSRFKNITYGIDEVGFSGTSSNVFVFRINKTDLQTQDIEGCKKWLETNSFDIVYELNEYEECEINPILTQVFDNSTLIQILGGAISAYFKAKCIASYSRRIESIESRLDRVEESVFKAVDVVSAMTMATDLRSIDLSDNVEQTQRAQDTMLMESDMRLMSMELLVNSTKPVSTDIKYVMYDAKGGATIMSASYYNFIAMCIANKTQSPEYLENYMNLCLQTGRLDQYEFDKLHAMLYPTTTEQPTK